MRSPPGAGTCPGAQALGSQFAPAEEAVMATLAKGTEEQLTQVLGEAVVHIWSYLPPDVQHELFEEAITRGGERMRHNLALILHDHHARTEVRVRSIMEPDSLGG